MQDVGDIVVIELHDDLCNSLGLEVRQERISDVVGKFIKNVGFLLVIKQRPKLLASSRRGCAYQVGNITRRHVGEIRGSIR